MGTYEMVKVEDSIEICIRDNDIDKDSVPILTPAAGDSPEQVEGAEVAARLVSLDVFRGTAVVLMIIVDDIGGIIPSISHSPWNGVTIADFVMPFFLFIVGVSLALAYKRVKNKVAATKKAVFRALKLFILGLVLQGGYFHGIKDLSYGVDILHLRWMGILQRIAIAFLLLALCEIWLQSDYLVDSGSSLLLKYQYQLVVGVILVTTHLILLYGIFVPDWEYQIGTKTLLVKCRVRGDTGPGCNAAGFIDRKILGIQHMYSRPSYARMKQCSIDSPNNGPMPNNAPSWCRVPFDPEGLLSSVMAVVTCLIGVQFGHVIVHFNSHENRILKWLLPSFCLIIIAFFLEIIGMDMNKALYSLSYTCITTGTSGLLFTSFYILVDVYGCRRPTLVVEWIGQHALMIFILVACNIFPILIHGFYWKEPRNNILGLIGIGPH